MKAQRVTVIDGPLPPGIWEAANMEPHLETKPEHMSVLRELMHREPLFHRREFGVTRADFEKLMASDFWEISASGRRFSRDFILDALEKRYEKPTEEIWELRDFHCFEIASDNYVAAYTLIQGERVTRRSTIWRRTSAGWQVAFHQGTLVAHP